jgi:glucokinase
MRVLAGDIGGTKTALAIVEIVGPRASVRRMSRYPSRQYGSLEEILSLFLRGHGRPPAAAGLGVAGPVRAGKARVTKLPWLIDERRLGAATGIARVRLLNDFVAAALGIPYVGKRGLATLREGEAEPGAPIGLIGAGTGLGQAALSRVAGRYEPLASEGGHADFGPRSAVEDRLIRFVRKRFGRVDRDRLLSGEGLTHLYDFFKSDGFAPESPAVARAFLREDRAAVISRFGLARRDRLCREALSLFVSIYGSEAGNLALQYRATGGVFIAGGIAPKILPAMRDNTFLEAFGSKPPLEELLSRIPVHVVLDPRLPLFGAASAAYRISMDRTRPPSKTITRPRAR